MSSTRVSCGSLVVAAAILTICSAAPARAQLNGENLLGDNGVKSGTQPEPGFYVGNLYYRYKTDRLRDANGQTLPLLPDGTVTQSITAITPLAIYVSRAKVFGANYGAMVVMPFANGALEAPVFGLDERVDTAASDLYVVPLQLGWHFSRADAIAAFGFFAPTGRYTAGADDNLGKGMWTYEVSGGGTVYLDSKRSISLATTAYWEAHSKKKDTSDASVGPATLTGIKVGQILTLEGGVAKSFLHGAASVGAAYYAQWKLTTDDVGLPEGAPLPDLARHRVFGFGPDLTLPVATKTKLLALVNLRYLWETGAQAKTEGQSFVLTTTFPIPGIKIGGTK